MERLWYIEYSEKRTGPIEEDRNWNRVHEYVCKSQLIRRMIKNYGDCYYRAVTSGRTVNFNREFIS